MKIELTLTEMMVLIDLIKDGATLNEIKQVVNKQPNQTIDEVEIGKQVWAKKDLKVTHFRNGDPIPLVEDDEEWIDFTTAAYCISPSGNYLYNWYAVNDPRGLAPEGWHVPSDDEWTELTDFLGGEEAAGIHMKSSPSDEPSWNGNNSSGFSALPGGLRSDYCGYVNDGGRYGYWWSASPDGTSDAWVRTLLSSLDVVGRDNYGHRGGLSVRCLRD